MPKFLPGTKFYKYENDELVVKRVVRCMDNDIFELKDVNGGSKTSMIISANDLKNQYVLLDPDTLITISCVTDCENVPDVYVCVHKIEALQEGENRPAMILRQNIYDDFKNESLQESGVISNKVYVGCCKSIIIETSYDYADDMMDIETIHESISIAGYLDDKVTDILKCIDKRTLLNIDRYLQDIYSASVDILPDAVGYCRSLSELLSTNNFMSHYRSLFNIWDIDFKIELDKRSYNEEGDIILNSKQKDRLEHLILANIDDVTILKYDKDIDISEIVTQKSHIVVCDPTDTIYLITYRVVSYYSENKSNST